MPWDLLKNYPNLEMNINPSNFEQFTSSPGDKSKVLVILGGDEGINVKEDEKKLKSLLGDRVQFLVKPNREELSDRLWEQSWDMLFFSGHSHTEGETGVIYINDTEKLTISDLKDALQKAIKSGLQLAIFNSCDGLGLAKDLADLNLPQMVVMREPIPDKVAQEFLKCFLDSFSTGKPFHLAVRDARERLELLENPFPSASCFPEIVQNLTPQPRGSKNPSTKWRQICQKMLNRRVSSHLLTGKEGVSNAYLNRVYVDLALMERRKQEKRELNIPAEEGSQLYQPREYEEKQRFEHQQFLQQILGPGQGTTQGRRVAIVGEPGAGKTTTLQNIARWLLSENQIEDYLPIWVSLAELQGQSLEDYLFETWLTTAIGKRQLTEEVKQEFEQQVEAGRVWLLLDGLDEMPVGDRAITPQEILKQQLQGSISSARVVVTCRLNLWEADNNALADFEIYRMLDFDVSGQEKFIRQFFQQQQDPPKAEKLQAQLKQSKDRRLRDLVKNPLRLTLLCTIWETAEAQLPETQAQLYQQFVQQIYSWKQDKFPTTESQRDELNRGLQTLALRGIENVTSPFRLSHDLVRQVLGDRDNESSLFYRALELGWLNEVGIAAEDATQKVYEFSHATFQEYFAALAIDDWRFFLDENYRIFDPLSKQAILVWLGRPDIAKEKKEEFIDALVTFEDGCEGFYHDRAYFLAAAATAEFKEGSRDREIVGQIIRWSLGEFNPNEWKCNSFDPKLTQAKIVLRESDREKTIALLRAFIYNSQNESARRQAVESLGEIGEGNPEAIASLLEIVRNSTYENTRSKASENLVKIARGNPEAIASLLEIMRHSTYEDARLKAATILGEIEPGNSEAIASLLDMTSNSNYEFTRSQAATSLGEISQGNPEAIASLLDIIRNSNSETTRTKAATILGKIGQGNLEAIAGLLEVIRTSKSEKTRSEAARSLGKIGQGNSDAIAGLLELIGNSTSETTRMRAARSLGKIGQGKSDAIAGLLDVISNCKSENTRSEAARSLGKIGQGNPEAIAGLLDIIRNYKSEETRSEAGRNLGTIERGNSDEIAGLLNIIRHYKSEDTRIDAGRNLGKIGERNSEAIARLLEVIRNSNSENTRSEAATSLEETEPKNLDTIAGLLDIIRNYKSENSRRQAAKSLGTIEPGNSEAISSLLEIIRNSKNVVNKILARRSLGEICKENPEAIAVLLDIIRNSSDELTRSLAAESLGKIGQENPEAIAVLLEIIRNSSDELTRSLAAESLGQIGQGNPEAISSLLELIRNTQDENTRSKAAESLGNIANTDEQICEVITGLKGDISQDIYQNQSEFFSTVYRMFWKWAQTLPYPVFYEAWQRGE